MTFKQLGARSFLAMLTSFSVDYKGGPSRRRGRVLDEVVMPLILASPKMEAALREIAGKDFSGATMFDDPRDPRVHGLAQAIRDIQELARRAQPNRPGDYVNNTP